METNHFKLPSFNSFNTGSVFPDGEPIEIIMIRLQSVEAEETKSVGQFPTLKMHLMSSLFLYPKTHGT